MEGPSHPEAFFDKISTVICPLHVSDGKAVMSLARLAFIVKTPDNRTDMPIVEISDQPSFNYPDQQKDRLGSLIVLDLSVTGGSPLIYQGEADFSPAKRTHSPNGP